MIRRGPLREWLALLLILAALAAVAQRGGWLEQADLWAYDLAATAAARPDIAHAADAPVIVAIDEESLARLGRWPWPRRTLAAILERLAAARAGPALVDVILAEPSDPADDARLAEAVRHYPAGVVLPVYAPEAADSPPVFPLPAFAESARLGHAHAPIDADGLVRRVYPSQQLGAETLPHVAWPLAGAGVPDEHRPMLVALSGPAGTLPRISASALLDGRVPAAQLQGRPVLIGATAVGLGDTVATPLAGKGGAMPGVEFVANVMADIRAGALARPLAGGLSLALSLVCLLVLFVAYLPASPRGALFATLAMAVAAAVAALSGLRFLGLWWSPATVIAAAALAYPLWSWRRLEASVAAMEREARRIAHLAPAAAGGEMHSMQAAGFFDPVETRIRAITAAVDHIADAIAPDGEDGGGGQRGRRNDMMRHLAHDLRAPLISLRGLAEELGEGAAGDETLAARVDRCAQRALDLSEQFLLFGRVDSAVAEDFGEVDLVDLLHRTADDLWEDGRANGVRIARRCQPLAVWARGDTRLLHRALSNLGWNALRHGPDGGAVTLFLDHDPAGGLRLGVHDEGAGFDLANPADYLPKAGSHGLGLDFVRRVAEKHRVELVAEYGDGFSIYLHFPPEALLEVAAD